jgi:hypothetical protein
MKEEHEWKSVQAIAVIQFGVSGLFIFTLFAMRGLVSSLPDLSVNYYVPPLYFAAGFFYLLLPLAFWIITGVGLLKRRKWADLLVRATNAVFIIFFSVAIIILIMIFETMMDLMNVEGSLRPIIGLTFFFVGMMYIGMFLGFPVFSLATLSRKEVQAVFDRDSHAELVSHISLPVAILMLIQVFVVVGQLFWILSGMRQFFFGTVITGFPAVLFGILLAVGYGLSTVLLYRNSVVGWLLGFLTSVVNWISSAVTFRRGIQNVFRDLYPDLNFSRFLDKDNFKMFREDLAFNTFLVTAFIFGVIYLIGLKKILDREKKRNENETGGDS